MLVYAGIMCRSMTNILKICAGYMYYVIQGVPYVFFSNLLVVSYMTGYYKICKLKLYISKLRKVV